jgi:hypothetical protein
MKLINVITILLLSGSSILLLVGCQKEKKEDIQIKSKFFLLGYELDFKSCKDSLHEITPIDIDCYFDFVNRSDKKLNLHFNYNNSSVGKFDDSQIGALFYTMANDSVIALQPLHKSATIQTQDHLIVPVKFRYRVSDSLRNSLRGNSMEQITSKLLGIPFFFKKESSNVDSIKVSNEDLYVYFMFSDTSITCSSRGCTSYIDPLLLKTND